MDANKSAVILASELGAQLENGNKRLVRETLRALPKAKGLSVVFYMRSNAQGSDTVGSLRRLLDTMMDEEDGD